MKKLKEAVASAHRVLREGLETVLTYSDEGAKRLIKQFQAHAGKKWNEAEFIQIFSAIIKADNIKTQGLNRTAAAAEAIQYMNEGGFKKVLAYFQSNIQKKEKQLQNAKDGDVKMLKSSLEGDRAYVDRLLKIKKYM